MWAAAAISLALTFLPVSAQVAFASRHVESSLLADQVDGQFTAPKVCPHDDRLYAVEVTSEIGHHLWLVDERSDEAVEMIPHFGGAAAVGVSAYYSGQLAWCPTPAADGDHRFVLITTAFRDQAKLYVGSLHTTELQRLAPDADMVTQPHWTPDGRSVVFVATTPGGARCFRVDLDAVPPEGTASDVVPTLLTRGPGHDLFPVTSPDGSFMVFTRYDETGADLWMQCFTDDAPGAAHRLTRLGGDETRATLSADGRWVAFYHAPDRDEDRVDLWCLGVDPSTCRPGRPAVGRVGPSESIRDVIPDVDVGPEWLSPESGEPAVMAVTRAGQGRRQITVFKPAAGRREDGRVGTSLAELEVITGVSVPERGRGVVCGQRGTRYTTYRVEPRVF